LIFSRLKICVKLFMTVVVPAPLDPVTATIGCLTDMRLSPFIYLVSAVSDAITPAFPAGTTSVP
jgi:hypothetical protein